MATVLRLQHTSIPMPADGHARARAFFGQALGMREVTPPKELQVLNLIWFLAGDDGHEVHLFVDSNQAAVAAAQHLCLQVDDLEAMRAQLQAHGVTVEETIVIPSRPRVFVHDPFNNFIELVQITGGYT